MHDVCLSSTRNGSGDRRDESNASDASHNDILAFFRARNTDSGFIEHLSAAITVPLKEFDPDLYLYSQTEWTPPSKYVPSRLVRALMAKLGIFITALKLIQTPARIKFNGKDTDKVSEFTKAHEEYTASVKARAHEMRIINKIYEHIDSHWPMMCAIDSRFSEHEISCLVPDTKYALTSEKMPKLLPLAVISMVHPYNDTSTRSVIRQLFADMDEKNFDLLMRIVDFVNKLVPNRSNIRQPHKSIQNTCQSNPFFAELMFKFLIASCLGIYDTSLTKASLSRRVYLYKLFGKSLSTKDVFLTFDEQTSLYLLYSAKEYYIHLISQTPAIHEYVKENSNWDAYELFTHLANEKLRIDCALEAVFGRAPKPPNYCMLELHRQFCARQFKTGIKYSLGIIMQEFKRINYSRYVLTCPEELIPIKFKELENPHPSVDEDTEETMRKIIALFDVEQPVPVSWLLYFGVPEETVAKFQTLVYSKRPKLKKFLMNLPMSVYRVFYTFIKLSLARHTANYPVDAYMYAAQLSAMLNKNTLSKGDAVPVSAGCMCICENCGNAKRQSSFPRKVPSRGASVDKIKTAAGFSGDKGNVMTMSDNTVVCACEPENIKWREEYFINHKEHPTSIQMQRKKNKNGTQETRKHKIAKGISTRLRFLKCRETPIKVLDALGWVSVHQSTVRLACMDDLRVCTFDRMRHYANRIVCRPCYAKRMAQIAANNGKYEPLKTQPPKSDSSDIINTTSKEIVPYVPRRPVTEAHNPDYIPCAYCEKRTSPDNRTMFELYDDSDVPKIRPTYFCSQHGFMSWVKTYKYTHKSSVIHSISTQKHSTELQKRTRYQIGK